MIEGGARHSIARSATVGHQDVIQQPDAPPAI